MARLIISLAALAALAPYVSAGITFTSPKPGDKLTAGTAIEVEFEENTDGAKISDLKDSFQLFLCAGGNDGGNFASVYPITTQGSFLAGKNKASALIPTNVGENTPANAYFIQMIAQGKTGGQLITYSDRFSYSGMSGAVFPANIKLGVGAFTGTGGPPTSDQTGDKAKPADANPAAGDFNVPYTMQTGTIRYAPMQPVPPTKITAKNPKPLYPTSSVSIATTLLPIPKIQTTITQSQTYSVSSRENTVAPAAHPTDDMQKYLNRWKD